MQLPSVAPAHVAKCLSLSAQSDIRIGTPGFRKIVVQGPVGEVFGIVLGQVDIERGLGERNCLG